MVRRPLGNHHDGPDTLLVTPETTHTEPVTAETARLASLVASARYVLWDLDGPICRLFASYRAPRIAGELVAKIDQLGMGGLLAEQERSSEDPHDALRAVHEQRPGSDLVLELEEWLTRRELDAVPGAFPTPHTDPLIRTWWSYGVRFAITTNNSAKAAAAYVESRGLSDCFPSPYVYGRTPNLDLMKPNPHCLVEAIKAMGAVPSGTLMIGDAATDLDAARQAGVAFLGYARNEHKERFLREAGAETVVRSMKQVLDALPGRP
ncbi:HAD family hydrolase [Streptomyces pseudovenezuelae]|uniref:HAD hydrolase-like protein n=1 Tax=Streptomyces pseudovenezuelae TaxID=67350 RepID=A0ABZ1WXI6_9ACTN|nr:HAD family hydrolase [Streptomyces pseudovenezuelae]WUA90119.1 HAD hydrolase-like protein [Streptomyces pseudovenezuelae]